MVTVDVNLRRIGRNLVYVITTPDSNTPGFLGSDLTDASEVFALKFRNPNYTRSCLTSRTFVYTSHHEPAKELPGIILNEDELGALVLALRKQLPDKEINYF